MVLFYTLLDKALTSCDDIDYSFGYIIENQIGLVDHIRGAAPEEYKNIAITLKREMSTFRRRVVPLREAFKQLSDDNIPDSIIPAAYRIYFQDLFDGSQRIMDNIQIHYDDSLELQRRLGQLDASRDAKVQFIISMALAFFSPLSFIVGLYGMNFEGDAETGTGGIPELTWQNGYTYVWLLMMSVVLVILVLFCFMGVIPLPFRLVKKLANLSRAQRRAHAQ